MVEVAGGGAKVGEEHAPNKTLLHMQQSFVVRHRARAASIQAARWWRNFLSATICSG